MGGSAREGLQNAMKLGSPIIITGVARGGTSLVAGMCHHLGLPLGKGGPRYENPYLQWAATQEKWDAVAKMGEILSAHHEVWGWKLPALHRRLDLVHEIFPQSRFIMVFKDPVSVSLRKVSSSADSMVRLDRTVGAYKLMSSFSRANSNICHVFSYSNILESFDGEVVRISEIVGSDRVDPHEIRRKIDEDYVRYQNATYMPRLRGEVDRLLSAVCSAYGVERPAKAKSDCAEG